MVDDEAEDDYFVFQIHFRKAMWGSKEVCNELMSTGDIDGDRNPGAAALGAGNRSYSALSKAF